jgi:hypothetical protein
MHVYTRHFLPNTLAFDLQLGWPFAKIENCFYLSPLHNKPINSIDLNLPNAEPIGDAIYMSINLSPKVSSLGRRSSRRPISRRVAPTNR